jgi:hypothetical protein
MRNLKNKYVFTKIIFGFMTILMISSCQNDLKYNTSTQKLEGTLNRLSIYSTLINEKDETKKYKIYELKWIGKANSRDQIDLNNIPSGYLINDVENRKFEFFHLTPNSMYEITSSVGETLPYTIIIWTNRNGKVYKVYYPSDN